MITLLDIFFMTILTLLIALAIPFAVISNIYNKIPKRSPTLLAMLFIVLFYSSLIFGSENLAANAPQVDDSESFTFTGSIIGEVDMLATREANFEQAISIHDKMVAYNLTDPLSFLYEDSPNANFNTSRTLQIVQSDQLTYSNYYINVSNNLKPTLLKINASLTPIEKKEELKDYTLAYLNPEGKNVSELLTVDIENRVPALGETYRELLIRMYDNETSNMVLIMLSYDLETGFAELVNIVYTTSEYSFDSPSSVYLETYYSIPSYEQSSLFIVINVVSVAGLICWILFLFIKRNTKNQE